MIRAARTSGATCACYNHQAHTWSPEFMEARRQSVSVPHDYTQDLTGIQAPVLLNPRAVQPEGGLEVSIAVVNRIADWHLVLLHNCGHWPHFEGPTAWAARYSHFLRGY
jgi:2-hydroxy-6-oxonona-2,4-dienedioate hydrolase